MPVLGDQAASPAAAFSLQELSGDGRLLTLLGRALPYRPIEFSGSMRASITYYAGNPVGTIQVLGAQEEQTTINGYWKDRFIQTTDFTGVLITNAGQALLNGTPVANVKLLVHFVDDFRRKGQLLEIRWDEHIRRGILTKFTTKWHNPHDAEWEMTFTWISQGEDEAPPAFMELDQQTASSDLAASAAAALASATPPTTVPASVTAFSTVEALANNVTAAIQEAEDTVARTVAKAMAPIDAAYRMLSALQRSVAAAQGFMDFTQQQVDRAVIGKTISTVTLGQTLVASLYLRQMRVNSRSYRSVALRHREESRDRIALRSAPQVHIVQQGEDLRDVAIAFYGSADDWRRIALFNNLGGASVPPGTQILVPISTRDASRAGAA